MFLFLRVAIMWKKIIIFLGILLLSAALIYSFIGGEDLSIAKEGSTVRVNYTGTLEDGTVFDTSEGREPLEFTIGQGDVITGFEEAIKGMRVGDRKMVIIPSDQAYGPHLDELVFEIERSQLPAELDPEVGQQLHMQHETAGSLVVIVIAVSQTTITIDANHPLVEKDLTFEIDLLEIILPNNTIS
jgi:peptidylprolyl isomerase